MRWHFAAILGQEVLGIGRTEPGTCQSGDYCHVEARGNGSLAFPSWPDYNRRPYLTPALSCGSFSNFAQG